MINFLWAGRGPLSISFGFELRDIWIGVRWTRLWWPKSYQHVFSPLRGVDVYICIIPCLPIRIHWSVRQK